MTGNVTRACNRSTATYYEASGFPDSRAYEKAPEQYACRLIRYLRDDSTVRARVADQFGIRLPIARIAALRAEVEAQLRSEAEMYAVEEATPLDIYNFRVSDRPFRAADESVFRHGGADGQAARVRVVTDAFCSAQRPVLPVTLCADAQKAGKAIGVKEVLHRIAHDAGVRVADLTGAPRHKALIQWRQLAYAVFRARGRSWVQAGRYLGRDHSTALYGAQRFFERHRQAADKDACWRMLVPKEFAEVQDWAQFRALLGEGD